MAIDPKQVQAAEQLAAAMAKVAEQAAKMKEHTKEQGEAMRDLASSMSALYDKLGLAAEKISETMKQGKENTQQNATASMDAAREVAETQISEATRATARLEALAQAHLDKENKWHSDKMQRIQEEIDGIEDITDAMSFLQRQLKERARDSAMFAAGLGAAAGAMSGLKQGITNVLAVGKGLFGFATGLADAMFNVAASIIAIPFKLFNGLINMASSGSNELAQAIENLRKEFGALTGPTPKAILGLSTTMTGFADTGLSVWRVFGSLAQRIELLTKLAHTMGASFNTVRQEFIENGGALLAYQKGLGLADEDMKAMAERAITVGSKVGDSLRDVTKHADGMGRAFNMDAKVISRDMSKAAADVKHFANSTAKELSVAVTYSRSLGVELGKIVGIMDAFETFDSAAENAAKLSQTFGAQVDAFKMMEAQNPADQIEMVRKAMREAGQDASNFNRQQLKLLASTTGLDEATASQVFSLKNQGKSLEEIRAEAAKSEKKTLTQAEAMKKLSDSIERLVQSGGSGGGFFERFFKGFLDGLSWTKEFQGMLRNINMSLFSTEQIGRKTGASFLDAFPPLRDFFQGLREFFDPKHFTKFFTKFSETLKKFFNDAATGKFSFGELMKVLQDNFFDFFNEQEGPGQKILKGFKGIMEAIRGIVVSGIEWISQAMASAISVVTDYIANPEKAMASMKSAGEKSGIMAFFGPLLDAINNAWKVLKDPIYNLFMTVGKAIFDYLTSDKFFNLIRPALPYLAAVLFGPMIGQAILGAITGVATQMIVGGAKQAFSALFMKAQPAIAEAAGALNKVPATPTAGAGDTTTTVMKAGEGAAGPAKTLSDTKINWGAVGTFLLGFAGVVVIGVGAFLYAARKIQEEKIGPTAIASAAATIIATATAALEVAGVMKLLENIKIQNPAGLIAGLVAVGLVTAALAGLGYLLAKGLKGVELTDVAKAIILVMGMATATVFVGGAIAMIMAAGAVVQGPQVALVAVGLAAMGLMMYALFQFGKQLVQSIKDAKFDTTEIKNALVFTGLMAAVPLAVMVGLASLAGVGLMTTAFFGPILAGFIAMELSFDRLAAFANKIVELAKGMPADVKPRVDMLLDIVKALTQFTESIAKVLGALNIGMFEDKEKTKTKIDGVVGLVDAIFTGSKDKPGGGVIGVVKTIHEAANQLGSSETTIAATKALAETLQAVTGFVNAMGGSNDLLTAVEKSTWFGSDQSVNSVIRALNEKVTTVGGQVVKIVQTIKTELIDKLGTTITKETANFIPAISGLLSAVTGVIGAFNMSPQEIELLKKAAEGDGSWAAGDLLNKMSERVKTIAPVMTDMVKNLMPSFENLFSTLGSSVKGFSENDVKALGSLNPLLSGMIQIATIITAQSMNLARQGDIDAAKVKEKISMITGELPGVLSKLSEAAPGLLKGIKSGILAFAGLDPGMVKSATDSFTAIINLTKSVMDLGNSVPSEKGGFQGFRVAQVMDEVALFFAKIAFDGTTGSGEPPLRRINNALGKISEYKNLGSDTVKTLSTLFGSFKEVFESVSSFQATMKTTGAKSGFELAVKVEDMALFLAKIAIDGTTGSGEPPIKKLDNSILEISKFQNIKNKDSLKPLAEIMTSASSISASTSGFSAATKDITDETLKDSFGKLTKIITKLGELDTTLTTNSPSLTSLTAGLNSTLIPSLKSITEIGNKIKADAIAPTIKTVGDIIEAVQKLDDLLSQVAAAKPIDLKAKLGQIAKSAGLGAKASYTVNSNPINMTVNLQVYMDATKVEHAMVTQSSSIIRDRINFLEEKGIVQDTQGRGQNYRIEAGADVVSQVSTKK